MGDPYAGIATPIEAPPTAQSGPDPYAQVGAQAVIAHDITGKNGRVYRVLLNSEDQAGAIEHAINSRIDAGDPELTGKLDLPFSAVVHHPAPPPDASAPEPGLGETLLRSTAEDVGRVGQGIAQVGDLLATGAGKVMSIIPTIGAWQLDQMGNHQGAENARGVARSLAHPFSLSDAVDRYIPTSPGAAGTINRVVGNVTGGAVALPGAAIDNVVGRAVGELPKGYAPELRTGGPINAIRRLTGRDNTIGARLVSQKLVEDGIHPADAARVMTEAQANGTPTVLADLGENTRALAGSVSRQPGAARTIARNFTQERQMGQGERVRDAINRDLGPTTDVLAESDKLIGEARTAAGPLYERAYPKVIQSPRLDAILSTPAGKGALKRAVTIAANEGRDPMALGVQFDAAGDPVMTRTASTQTLDYVKRGLDDIIEQNRSPLTGKLQLDEYGRSVNDVKSRLLAEMDRLNPDYAAARQAYAGPASLRSAMMDGKAALNKTASEIRQRIKNMSPAEADQYGLGLRSAIADQLQGSADGANKVRMLIGNPKRRAALTEVFGGKANLDRFLSTLENEQAAFETHGAVNRGSPTAERLSEDQANSDLNLLKGLGADVASIGGGQLGIAARVAQRGMDVARYGAGKAGNRAREDAASLLFSASPSEFKDALGELSLKARREFDSRRALSIYGVKVGTGASAAVARYGK